MPPAAPSFGSQDYWNKRFTSNSNPFEWLEAPTVLDPYIIDALESTIDSDPQLLHIGCGTSLLSFHLRAHVGNPGQIHNLDYSEVAIDVGRKREAELLRAEGPAPEEGTESRKSFLDATRITPDQCGQSEPATFTQSVGSRSAMRWSSANLLDQVSLLKVCKPSAYSVVVDKSTSDSIACSDDLHVSVPCHIAMSAKHPAEMASVAPSEPLHPLHIMAVNLALITKPRGQWISLSYSADRYPFLPSPTPNSTGDSENWSSSGSDEDLSVIPHRVVDDSFPDPSILWRLVRKCGIATEAPQVASNNQSAIHRPKVFHWIYVLERTDVPLLVRA